MLNVLESFRQAAEARGLILPEVQADGLLHRCDVQGRNGKDDGAYKLHLDRIPAGGFQNWQDGLGWQNWRYCGPFPHSRLVRRTHRRLIAVAKRDQRVAQEAAHAAAADKAGVLWAKASRAPVNPSHPYLVNKGIVAFGLGQLHDTLVVPVRAGNGCLQSLQFINNRGDKRFLRGGRIAGGFHVIGDLIGDVIVIAEGYATAASIHMATGHPVAIAFNCGNLESVALHMRHTHPQARIVIAADDDDDTEGNPGLTKARNAAARVGAHVAIPKGEKA